MGTNLAAQHGVPFSEVRTLRNIMDKSILQYVYDWCLLNIGSAVFCAKIQILSSLLQTLSRCPQLFSDSDRSGVVLIGCFHLLEKQRDIKNGDVAFLWPSKNNNDRKIVWMKCLQLCRLLLFP